MVHLGPLSRGWLPDDDPLDALTPEDREWLELMADVLPRHMPVDGTEWGWLCRVDPWITQETVR